MECTADLGGEDREGRITLSSKSISSMVTEEMQLRLAGQPGESLKDIQNIQTDSCTWSLAFFWFSGYFLVTH